MCSGRHFATTIAQHVGNLSSSHSWSVSSPSANCRRVQMKLLLIIKILISKFFIHESSHVFTWKISRNHVVIKRLIIHVIVISIQMNNFLTCFRWNFSSNQTFINKTAVTFLTCQHYVESQIMSLLQSEAWRQQINIWRRTAAFCRSLDWFWRLLSSPLHRANQKGAQVKNWINEQWNWERTIKCSRVCGKDNQWMDAIP